MKTDNQSVSSKASGTGSPLPPPPPQRKMVRATSHDTTVAANVQRTATEKDAKPAAQPSARDQARGQHRAPGSGVNVELGPMGQSRPAAATPPAPSTGQAAAAPPAGQSQPWYSLENFVPAFLRQRTEPAAPPGAGESDSVAGSQIDTVIEFEMIERGELPPPPPSTARRDATTGATDGRGSTVGSLSASLELPFGAASDQSTAGSPEASWLQRDAESLDYAGPNRTELSRFDTFGRIERSSLETAVRTAKILDHVAEFDPSKPDFRGWVHLLTTRLDASTAGAAEVRSSDSSSQTRFVKDGEDVTTLVKAREELPRAIEALQKNATATLESRQAFWDYKAGQQENAFQPANQFKRHVMGSDAHAVAFRAAVQTAITVSAGIQFQQLAAQSLRWFFSSDTSRIPEAVLDGARAELVKEGAEPTQNAIIKRSIDDLSKLSSTYFDEATTPPTVVAVGDPLVAGSRSGIAAVTDSKNERNKRTSNVQSATDKAANPEEKQTRMERYISTTRRVRATNFKSNMISGGIAATVGLVGGGNKPGYLQALEAAKTLAFAALAGESNTQSDGVREALYQGKSELVSQFWKAGARTVGRVAAYEAKTGIGHLQAFVAGTLNARSPIGDFGISGVVTAVGSGGMKELVGGLFQYAGNKLLPPDEAALLSVVKTIDSVADVNAVLNTIAEPGILSAEDAQALQDISYKMNKFLVDVSETSTLKFDQVAFNNPHGEYEAELAQRLNDRREARSE